MEGTFSVSNITDTTATLIATVVVPPSQTVQLGVGVTPVGGAELVFDLTVPGTVEVGDTIDVPLSGLTPATVHEVTCTGFDSIEFTTKATGYNDPRIATQGQWEDMIGIIKSKADSSDTPSITMTTTDPGEGAAIGENEYIGVYGEPPIIMDYSTSEVNTGIKWIDGSYIYKKTVSLGTAPNKTGKTVQANIANLDKMIRLEGMAYSSTGVFYFGPTDTAFYADTLLVGSGSWMLGYSKSNDSFTLTTASDRSNCTAYATIWYTKSS